MVELRFDLKIWQFLALISSIPLFYHLYRKANAHLERRNALLAKARTQHQSVDIALCSSVSYPEIPSAHAAKISKATLCELIAMREAGKVTCEEMVLTAVHNARVWGRQFNVVAYEHIDEAVALARKYDRIIASKEPHGPLLGIPFSVKDCIATKNSPFTAGCASMANYTQFEDANIVRVLKEAGAILLFKGSMGMLGASSETENRIVGRAANPWDVTRTPGGSSGGDAVLVSTRTVPFGAGTDIGGSLRYPAAYCGLYALKPTAPRLSGMAPIVKGGYPPIFPSWGFMTRSVEDLALLFSIEYGENLFSADPLMPPIHWREDRYTSTAKLKIGYVLDNDYWPVADCCQRAVAETVTALQAQGHELVKFELFGLEELMELIWKVMMANKNSLLLLKEEPLLRCFRDRVWRREMPSPFIALCYHLNLKGKESMLWKALYETTIQDMILSNFDAECIRNKYFQAMQTQGIDALIVPYPFPAFPHGLTDRNTYSVVWTMLFNLLDMPVGSVPVGKVRENEQFYHKGEDKYVKSTAEVMKGAAGLPISVQVVTKRYQEELCLNIMRQIAKEIPFAEAPPGVEALLNA